jgi:hypothetical protein
MVDETSKEGPIAPLFSITAEAMVGQADARALEALLMQMRSPQPSELE